MTELPEGLERYLAVRQADRERAVDVALARLTPQEQRLVREAAVMGYVQGMRSGAGPDDRPPPDTVVMRLVVDACLALPDLYPVISAYSPEWE